MPPIRFVTLYAIVLFVVPAYLIVPGTGAAGSPTVLLGLVALVWWLVSQVGLGEGQGRPTNPVRLALLIYAWTLVLSWTLGKMRILTPLEGTQSDRTLIVMLGCMGIALLIMDGLETLDEIERLAKVLTWSSLFMVFVGLVQFFLHYDIAAAIRFPGLVPNYDDLELESRSDFTRPRGTALHPIEFGVVAASLVPIAYWTRQLRVSKRTLVPLAGLGFAAMVSLSRSAVLALAVAGAVLLVAVDWRQRINLFAVGAIFVGGVGVVVKGLVGTLRSLFTQASNDPSVRARVNRFPQVVQLISEYPWLGRGYGTYNIKEYLLLDNELQKTAIEAGLIGVAVLIVFTLFVSTTSWRLRALLSPGRDMASPALTATILGLFVSSYTFDAFYYRILTGILYISIGLVGALWRISHQTAPITAAPGSLGCQRLPSNGDDAGVVQLFPLR